MSDAQVRDEIEKLRESADEAAKNCRNVFLTFLLVGLYIAVLLGSTTDEQLLRGSGVVLPLIDVQLPIAGVFAIVPPLFVVLHFNMLLQLYLLSRKLHRLDQAIDGIASRPERDELRDRIFPFVFSHMIVGHHHGVVVRALIHLMMWLTLAILPVLLLLWAQLAFLPYHGWWITWGPHRVSIVADLFLLWLFLLTMADPEGRWRPGDTLDGWLYPRRVILAISSGLLSLAVLWLSFSVFLIPGNWLDRTIGTQPVIAWALGEEGYGGVLGHRNLWLPEATLLKEEPSPEMLAATYQDPEKSEQIVLAHTKGLDLKDRDLRFAVLQGANLTKADFDGAQLQGADLVKSKVQRAILSHADMRGANLAFANLQESDLLGAQMQGTSFLDAQLQGANLVFADLQVAVLSGTQLQGADLSGAQLLGADLSRADLSGADLSGADLSGANLVGVQLYGADFSDANLNVANLTQVSWEPLHEGAWDEIRLKINKTVAKDATNIRDRRPPVMPTLRDQSLSRLEAARERHLTILPGGNDSWVVRVDPPPAVNLGVEPWPLPAWWNPETDLTEYYKRLVALLDDLACQSEPFAQNLSLRAIYSFDDDGEPARRLARAIWVRRDSCPGFEALSVTMLSELQKIAEPGEEESRNRP